jgi:6,7-dimethyl-8-ribityllumazine synthase
MSRHAPSSTTIDGSALTIGIAAARFNERLVNPLLRQVQDGLRAAGVRARRITLVRVPGSNELPSAVQLLCARLQPDVCIALGVIIRGETRHYRLVAENAWQGLLHVALAARVPVINGVIVVEDERQAVARCTGRRKRGADFAHAALAMGALKRRLSR